MYVKSGTTTIKMTARRWALIGATLAGVFAAGIVAASPKIETWTTANGARVYFVPAPELPIVDVRVVFDAGSAKDAGKDGVAQLTNGLLGEGAGELNADQIAERFEGLGAQFGGDAQRDMAIVSLRSLTEPSLLAPALATLATVLTQPTFPADAFERERTRTLVALRSQEESPEDIASKAFFAALYPGHPYGTPPLGSEASIKALSRDDLVNFYQRYYVARNATLAIVGAVDRAAAEKIAEQVAGQLPAGQAAAIVPAAPLPAEAKLTRLDYPSGQTHILLGQPGVTRDDPDYFPLYVGNHILGGSGLVSRISDEVREKRGLSYSSYSYFVPMRAAGPFTAGLQTRNDQADQALTVLQDVMKEFIAKGPKDAELTAAKKNITGGFALRLDSNSKIVENLAMIGFYQLPLDYLDTFNKRIEAVTAAQIRDAFQRRIHPQRMVTVIVGGAAAKPAP
ncbi:MAG: pitrilysin family protein [Pseudomonadota bacterium]